mgnify:CR=1 FL=1
MARHYDRHRQKNKSDFTFFNIDEAVAQTAGAAGAAPMSPGAARRPPPYAAGASLCHSCTSTIMP